MSLHLRRAPLALPLGVLLALLGERAAFAGTFDPGGVYHPSENAVATDDFEAYPTPEGQGGAGGEAGAAGAAGEGGSPEAGGDAGAAGGPEVPAYPYQLVDDPTALTGTKVFTLGPWQSAGVGFAVPPGNGSYAARVWVKGEVVATVEVRYGDGSAPTLSQLFPTGRVTSDGWAELESAPFSVDAAHQPDPGVGFFSPTGVTADAFEVVPMGEFRPVRACTGVNDATSCLPDEMCLFRSCVDARGLVPPIPSTPEERVALADFMGNRIKFLFGPLRNRELYLDDAMASIDVMRTTEDRYRFWFSFVTAIQKLQDSHSTVFGLFQFQLQDFPGRVPLTACFIGGDADATHDQVPRDPELPDVLVSHTGQGGAWGLKAGDRLVAIDGEHPIAWAKKLQGRSWSAEQVNDPTSLAQFVESLRGKITMLARTITVIRCDGLKCGAPEMIKVADVPPPDGPVQGVGCDNRPLPHFPNQPENHNIGEDVYSGLVNESTPEERIHGMVWDSLYGNGNTTGVQINSAFTSFRNEKVRGVILDHRTGNGGTKDAASPILSFVSLPKYTEVDVWRVFLDDMGPKTKEEGLLLFDKIKDEPLSLGFQGSPDAAVDVPVALLITRDVSASDFFPNAFKGSPKARIFGPNPTNGAFSTFLGYSYWLSLSFQLASEDTLNHDGTMLCAHGVAPDEIVEPRQSDLIQGVDTVYEAALAWVRANLKPQEAP